VPTQATPPRSTFTSVTPHAAEHVDRRRTDPGVPFQVHADRRAGIDTRAIVAAFISELHARHQPAGQVEAGATLEDALGRAREQRFSVIADHRDRLDLLLGSAVVVGARAHAEAKQRAQVLLRRIALRRRGGRTGEQHDKKNTHAAF